MDIKIFEDIKKINEYDQEVWYAREFGKTLHYEEYEDFEEVIKKAMIACDRSGQSIQDHFGGTMETVEVDGEIEQLPSYQLSRFACYLVVLNADPSKDIVALWQSYFALQTRRQEINDQKRLGWQYEEDQRRIVARDEMKEHNKNLASVAKKAGVKNYAQFTDAGYMWLYGNKRKKDIAKNKWLDPQDNILDYMSSEELWANLFRATQTEAKLKRELEQWTGLGEEAANKTHFEVGKKVRETISELGGTMPENLPKVEHIKEATRRLKELSYDDIDRHIAYVQTHVYDLPEDIESLQKVVDIIKNYPGDLVVKLWDKVYQLDSQWLEKIKHILE